MIIIIFSFYCEAHAMYNDIKEEFCSIAIKESSDLIDRIEEHPFHVELMNGKLSYKKFKFYVQQTFYA